MHVKDLPGFCEKKENCLWNYPLKAAEKGKIFLSVIQCTGLALTAQSIPNRTWRFFVLFTTSSTLLKAFLRLQTYLFNCTILPALTYASETWVLGEQDENAIQVSQRGIERVCLKYHVSLKWEKESGVLTSVNNQESGTLSCLQRRRKSDGLDT